MLLWPCQPRSRGAACLQRRTAGLDKAWPARSLSASRSSQRGLRLITNTMTRSKWVDSVDLKSFATNLTHVARMNTSCVSGEDFFIDKKSGISHLFKKLLVINKEEILLKGLKRLAGTLCLGKYSSIKRIKSWDASLVFILCLHARQLFDPTSFNRAAAHSGIHASPPN